MAFVVCRLGLERGKTAKEALQVITEMLQTFGQGGPCSEQEGLQDFVYHNSFIIADPSEAWVLETSGHHWAAEKVNGMSKVVCSYFCQYSYCCGQ